MSKHKYYCPCCGHKPIFFIRGIYRWQPYYFDTSRYVDCDQYVICPFCGSLPRHRILISYLQSNPDLLQGSHILIFAAEYSVKKWLKKNGTDFITADIQRSADLKIDITDTGLDSDSYDLIICNHVLEHVYDYRAALKELYRIVIPGGHVILSFPLDYSLDSVYEDASITTRMGRIKAFGQHDHLRIFGADTKKILEDTGFGVEEICGRDFDSAIKPLTGPADYDSDVLFFLTKQA